MDCCNYKFVHSGLTYNKFKVTDGDFHIFDRPKHSLGLFDILYALEHKIPVYLAYSRGPYVTDRYIMNKYDKLILLSYEKTMGNNHELKYYFVDKNVNGSIFIADSNLLKMNNYNNYHFFFHREHAEEFMKTVDDYKNKHGYENVIL